MKLTRKQIGKALVPGLLLLLILAACSQEEPTATPAPPEPTPEAAVEEATAVPEATAETETESTEQTPEISQPIYSWGEVADRQWILVGYDDALNPIVVPEGTVITAVFSSIEPTLSGSGGCNNYFTGYSSTDDGGLTINSPIGSTMMACESGAEQEGAYFAALETVTGWALTAEGRLELTYSTNDAYEQKLVYASGETPLTGTNWQLVSWGDPESLTAVEAGTTVTALFTPETDTTGNLSGNATCNSYSTGYTLDGNNISVGPVAGTMMMCPVGADQEAAYLAALSTSQTYEIIGANMQITYEGGVLNFTSLNLPLENVLWQAVMVAGQPVPEGIEITALFEPEEGAGSGLVGGSTGCNSYNTSYEASSDITTNPPTNSLAIGTPMAVTLALCPGDELAELERSYLGALEGADTYEIFGDQLVISGANGAVQYAANRQPLTGTLWTLVSIGSADDPQPPIEGSNFTAQFSRLPSLPSGTVTGETGCNSYNATYTSNLTEIKVNLPATTRQACGDALAEAEQQFFLGLNAATNYRILGDLLQIPYGEDDSLQVLNFEGSPPPVEPEALDLSPLQGTFWYLSAIGDSTILPGTEVTAEFLINEGGTTGTISGSGGCNGYNAPIGENFAIGPIATTAKACAQPVMDQEGTYFSWLQTAYSYDRAGDQLLISTANGVLTFNSTPILDQSLELQNKTWYLLSYETLNTIAGSNPTAFFGTDGVSLSGNTGCNDYTGAYSTKQGNEIAISNLANTQAACSSEALTQQETTFLRLLPASVSYSVNGVSLQIVTVDGGTMLFTSVPPVAPAGPTAVIISEDLAETGQPINFDGTQSTAGAAPIVRYDWNMGDGAVLSGPNVQYAYNTPGSFSVSLTVTDQNGQSNTTTKSVQITPVQEVTPPTAVIEGPPAAFVGEQVTFSAANSQQGTAAITGYQWQSGEGVDAQVIGESTYTTIYSFPGTYYPSVTVFDAAGLSDGAGTMIVINASLYGTDWLLGNTIPGTSISLNFANGTLSGFSGCNSYNAGYTTTLAAGNTNSISVGPIASTGALCTDEIMSQEQGYLAALQTASVYTIGGTTLTLTTATGPLVFNAAIPTPYAGP